MMFHNNLSPVKRNKNTITGDADPHEALPSLEADESELFSIVVTSLSTEDFQRGKTKKEDEIPQYLVMEKGVATSKKDKGARDVVMRNGVEGLSLIM